MFELRPTYGTPTPVPAPQGAPFHRYRRWIGPSLLVVVALGALVPLAAVGGGAAPPSSTPPALADATATPDPTAGSGATVKPAPTRTPYVGAVQVPPSPRPSTAPTGAPTATPRPTPTVGPAPTSSFVAPKKVDLLFPLAAGTQYRYRDNYGEPRPGGVEPYNHVFGVREGKLLRAHDGIDIYAARGTSILAPFAGRVIDPAERWTPWRPERYGACVVIVSSEAATKGYAALLCHLDERNVRIGANVKRGRVVGTLGVSGNAENSPAQLHFELRAPHPTEWDEPGGTRLVDAFNPYRSLRAADPAITN